MKTIANSLVSLSNAGFKVYSPIVPSDNELVLEYPDGALVKALLRRASPTQTTPIITLTQQQLSPAYYSNYQYYLISLPENNTTWLIPVELLMTGSKTIRLGQKYDDYVLKDLRIRDRIRTEQIKASTIAKLKEIARE